jgi:hypothetical protein
VNIKSLHTFFTRARYSPVMMSRTKPIVFLLAAAAVLLASPPAVFASGARVAPNGDLVIDKSGITPTAAFFPYKSGKILLEVLALRAPDGTVRTALNTCQVCYSSGRGYYVQKGDVLVCQNCGNRFKAAQVELIKGGCNPIPITKDLKTETAETITISKELLNQAAPLFANWKKR